MKTASLPSLRVDPELCSAAESVLKDGETLSAFVEDSRNAAIGAISVLMPESGG